MVGNSQLQAVRNVVNGLGETTIILKHAFQNNLPFETMYMSKTISKPKH